MPCEATLILFLMCDASRRKIHPFGSLSVRGRRHGALCMLHARATGVGGGV